MNAQLKASQELVTLREAKDELIYTSQKLLQKELALVEKIKNLAEKNSFGVSSEIT